MAVPEEIRARVTEWCAACLPADARNRRRIAFTSVGDTLTVLDRRPPAVPELGTVWSSTPLARLRREQDTWALYLPTSGGDRWVRQEPGATDPLTLLATLTDAVRATD
ncbi:MULTISPECIES: hypothetical protein [Pseudonocardia]|uniref:Uncharacterized protein n=1 Tax=Pseudonocardia oroxyli TaxID=366584 RepID=A0A1G7LJ69_PSEOR|nr:MULTISPECIES: hypothetical protein [Pseudonocardia]MCF7552006.1 hypothetical protein [Pseudonocardia sp. WMMC193]SDF48989.1 hypothetical protein SAMN05216377_10588 [Pseudonocardia oroxyli]